MTLMYFALSALDVLGALDKAYVRDGQRQVCGLRVSSLSLFRAVVYVGCQRNEKKKLSNGYMLSRSSQAVITLNQVRSARHDHAFMRLPR